MKKTKKLFAVGLAAALICVMTIPAFAEADNKTISGLTDSASFAVTGTYVAGGSAATVYSVDISWGSMDFTYTGASAGTWTPSTHTYDGSTEGQWNCDEGANVITVKNHSNAEVTVNFAYASAENYSGIKGDFSNDGKLALATAVGTEVENAPSGSVSLGLSGALTEVASEGVTIGTVTVTLANN